METKKQTAVEWLANEMPVINWADPYYWKGKLDQAKAMEKEQIEDAYWEGGQDIPTTEQRCQDYFNQTYGGDK
jgi:hypothetical protein